MPIQRVDYESAILMCEGKCRRPMRHRYQGGRAVHDFHRAIVAVHTMYSCDACSQMRIWGHEDPRQFSGPILLGSAAA